MVISGRGGVDAETITSVEAYGTATELGHPIEIEAFTRSFREETDQKGFCAIGSVMTNIGHMDCAACVAGLNKTPLPQENRLLPSSLHYEQPNPRIDFADSPFYVNTRPSEWKPYGVPRRAGVSAFGTVAPVSPDPAVRENARGAGRRRRASGRVSGATPSRRSGGCFVHPLHRSPTFQASADAGLSGCSGRDRGASRTRAGPGVLQGEP